MTLLGLAADAADVSAVEEHAVAHGPEGLAPAISVAAATADAAVREARPSSEVIVTVRACQALAARPDPWRGQVDLCVSFGRPSERAAASLEEVVREAVLAVLTEQPVPLSARAAWSAASRAGPWRVPPHRAHGPGSSVLDLPSGLPEGSAWTQRTDPPFTIRPYVPKGRVSTEAWLVATDEVDDLAAGPVVAVADPLRHRTASAWIGLAARPWASADAQVRAGPARIASGAAWRASPAGGRLDALAEVTTSGPVRAGAALAAASEDEALALVPNALIGVAAPTAGGEARIGVGLEHGAPSLWWRAAGRGRATFGVVALDGFAVAGGSGGPDLLRPVTTDGRAEGMAEHGTRALLPCDAPIWGATAGSAGCGRARVALAPWGPDGPELGVVGSSYVDADTIVARPRIEGEVSMGQSRIRCDLALPGHHVGGVGLWIGWTSSGRLMSRVRTTVLASDFD